MKHTQFTVLGESALSSVQLKLLGLIWSLKPHLRIICLSLSLKGSMLLKDH